MSVICVRTLGGLAVARRRGHEVQIAPSCRPVLGYLLAHRRRSIAKRELAEALWSDRDGHHARHCLATALWRLKKTFGDTAFFDEATSGEELCIERAKSIWVDAVAMEARLEPLAKRQPETLTSVELHRIERGVRLYRGDYLAGMDHEWAWLERQRLRDLYCDGLYQLMRAHAAAARWPLAIGWGRLLSREEPLREEVHRLLMLACLETGNRASAISQYRECERAIARDLGVAPMAETQTLYRRLVGAMPSSPTAPTTMPADSVHHHLGEAQRLLVLCQHQLAVARDRLDSGSPPQS